MASATVEADVAPVATAARPPIAHAWCTCYERDGITPIPSLCGHARKRSTPPAEDWPADMQACVICAQLAEQHAPCPRCGACE